MEIDTIRDVTDQLFPYRTPILIKKGDECCRVVIEYTGRMLLGFFEKDGKELKDILPIQSIFRLVEGGVAILFENENEAPFVHILQKDSDNCIRVLNIRGAEPVNTNEEFVFSENSEYNKLSQLFSNPKKFERIPSVI